MTTLQTLIAELKHLAEAEREEAALIDKLGGGNNTSTIIAGVRLGFANRIENLISQHGSSPLRIEETNTPAVEAEK